MSETPPPSTPAPGVGDARRVHLSEDWLATGVGLLIIAAGLLGLLPGWLSA